MKEAFLDSLDYSISSSLTNLGSVYINVMRLEEARTAYERAIQIRLSHLEPTDTRILGPRLSLATIDQALNRVSDVDTYNHDFRLNASLDYVFNKSLSIQLIAQNLIGTSGNKRYSYDTGNNKASTSRVRVTEEPRTIGIKFRYQF